MCSENAVYQRGEMAATRHYRHGLRRGAKATLEREVACEGRHRHEGVRYRAFRFAVMFVSDCVFLIARNGGCD